MRKTIEGLIMGFLLAIIAGGGWLYFKSRTAKPGEAKERAGKRPELLLPLMGTAQVDLPSWRHVSTVNETRSFRFSKLYGWILYGDERPKRRVVLSGHFESSQTFVHAALVSAEDFHRMQSGYPPLNVQRYVNPGEHVSVVLKPGLGDLAFFQTPPQPDPTKAKTLASLLAMSLEGLVGAPPAAISADFKIDNQIFGTSADVTAAKREISSGDQ